MSHYFDHNAATPCHPKVIKEIDCILAKGVGNPSSQHRKGREAKAILDMARTRVADLLQISVDQLIFTSGGTEANNLVLQGAAQRESTQGKRRIAISAIEHASVYETALVMAERGDVELAVIGVDAEGQLDLESLKEELSQGLDLVSVILANNETGVVQDISAISSLCQQYHTLLHTDAVQWVGKLPLDFNMLGVDFLSLSAHKFNGPMGVGAVIHRPYVDLRALLYGGKQERGYRAGTENVFGIHGLGVAAQIARESMVDNQQRLMRCGRLLEEELQKRLPEATIFSKNSERLQHTLMFSLPGVESQTLIMALDQQGFSLSSGSACGNLHQQPNRVLAAMGVEPSLAHGAVRISLGIDNREEDILQLVDAISSTQNTLTNIGAVGW